MRLIIRLGHAYAPGAPLEDPFSRPRTLDSPHRVGMHTVCMILSRKTALSDPIAETNCSLGRRGRSYFVRLDVGLLGQQLGIGVSRRRAIEATSQVSPPAYLVDDDFDDPSSLEGG